MERREPELAKMRTRAHSIHIDNRQRTSITGVMDVVSFNEQEIMLLFERINGSGTTVMVATHDRSLIQRMRKRVIGLERGRIAFDTPAPASLVEV